MCKRIVATNQILWAETWNNIQSASLKIPQNGVNTVIKKGFFGIDE